MKKYGKLMLCYILGFLPTLAAALAGVCVRGKLPSAFAWEVCFGVLLLALLAGNWFLKNRFAQGPNSRVTRRINDWMEALRHKAEADPEGFLRKGALAVRLSWGYYWLLVISVLAMVFFHHARQSMVWSAMLGTFLLAALVQVLLPPEKPEESEYLLGEQDYPAFYAAAREAARKMGMDRPLELHLGTATGVTLEGRTAVVCLGTDDAMLVTREEMEQILLHEMAHIQNADADRSTRQMRQVECWAGLAYEKELVCSIYLFLPQLALVTWSQVHRLLSSRHAETLADRAVVEQGDPQVFVNALAKSAMLRMFHNTNRPQVHSYYAPEEWYPELLTRAMEDFREALPTQEARWRHLLAVELSPRVDTHPIFRHRAEALGITEYRVDTVETDEGWLADVQRLLAYEAEVCRKDEDTQQAYRHYHESHCKREEVMTRFREAEAPLDTWEDGDLYDAGCAFFVLDNDRSLEIAEALLGRNGANPYALQLKGRILLDREDDAGAEYLFQAAQNANFADGAMEMVAKYALRHGKQELLDRYRGQGVDMAIEAIDYFKDYSDLGPRDEAVENDLPPEKAGELLEFILSRRENALQEVLTVKKLLPQGRHCYQYYMVFRPETSEEDQAAVMEAIFLKLDMEDEEFSIHIPDEKQLKLLRKKVPGCSVFRASQ